MTCQSDQDSSPSFANQERTLSHSPRTRRPSPLRANSITLDEIEDTLDDPLPHTPDQSSSMMSSICEDQICTPNQNIEAGFDDSQLDYSGYLCLVTDASQSSSNLGSNTEAVLQSGTRLEQGDRSKLDPSSRTEPSNLTTNRRSTNGAEPYMLTTKPSEDKIPFRSFSASNLPSLSSFVCGDKKQQGTKSKPTSPIKTRVSLIDVDVNDNAYRSTTHGQSGTTIRPKPHFPRSTPLRPLTSTTASFTLSKTSGFSSAGRFSTPHAGMGVSGVRQQRQKVIVPNKSWKMSFDLGLTQSELARIS